METSKALKDAEYKFYNEMAYVCQTYLQPLFEAADRANSSDWELEDMRGVQLRLALQSLADISDAFWGVMNVALGVDNFIDEQTRLKKLEIDFTSISGGDSPYAVLNIKSKYGSSIDKHENSITVKQGDILNVSVKPGNVTIDGSEAKSERV